MPSSINWNLVQQKSQRQAWAADLVQNLDRSFEDHLRLAPLTPPTEPSEWYHHYFCGTCATSLNFDFLSPHEHRCPSCQKVYTGEPWDGSWRMRVHAANLHHLERAALLTRLHPKQPKYGDSFRRTLLFYADHYLNYTVQGKNAGKGRLMPQCLDEAIFIIGIARSLEWAGPDLFSARELADLARKVFEPAVDLIKPQIGCVHNIHAWMQAMLAAAGAFLRDDTLIDFSLHSEFGWNRQIELGIREDGFWYEGSITYHYYTFGALSALALALHSTRPELIRHPRLHTMLEAPLGLVYPNGEFPAHNDCWKGSTLIVTAPCYELATGLGIADYSAPLAWLYNSSGPQPCVPSLEAPNPIAATTGKHSRSSIYALLFGPEQLSPPRSPDYGNRIYRASGIGILENQTARVCLRFHPDSGGHDHWDKLAVDVFTLGRIWSMDFGTSGYAAAITHLWHKTPPAHNLLIVDQKAQQPSSGELEDWQSSGKISARADLAYPDIRLGRTLQLLEQGWTDIFTVEAQTSHQFDWCFHGEGTIEGKLDWKPTHMLGDGKGYDQLSEIETAETDTAWSVNWVGAFGRVRLDFAAAPGTTVFRARCPSNPSNETLGFLLVRRHAAKTVFTGTFTVEP